MQASACEMELQSFFSTKRRFCLEFTVEDISVCLCSSILGRFGCSRLNAGVEGIAGADRRDRDRNVWTSCSGLNWGMALGSRHVSCRPVALVSLTLDWLMDVGLDNGCCLDSKGW